MRYLQRKKQLEYVPAGLLICDGINESVIQCNTEWEDISMLYGEYTIRLSYITDGQLNKCETYQLLQWNVQNNIERCRNFYVKRMHVMHPKDLVTLWNVRVGSSNIRF